MGDKSSIEWTESTWNPTTGCDRTSPGCDNCYALALAKRLKSMGVEKYRNDGDPRTSGPGFALTVHEDTLDIPYGWRQPRLVFVNSMSDSSWSRSSCGRRRSRTSRCASDNADAMVRCLLERLPSALHLT